MIWANGNEVEFSLVINQGKPDELIVRCVYAQTFISNFYFPRMGEIGELIVVEYIEKDLFRCPVVKTGQRLHFVLHCFYSLGRFSRWLAPFVNFIAYSKKFVFCVLFFIFMCFVFLFTKRSGAAPVESAWSMLGDRGTPGLRHMLDVQPSSTSRGPCCSCTRLYRNEVQLVP